MLLVPTVETELLVLLLLPLRGAGGTCGGTPEKVDMLSNTSLAFTCTFSLRKNQEYPILDPKSTLSFQAAQLPK
jgi:hypothetical protein